MKNKCVNVRLKIFLPRPIKSWSIEIPIILEISSYHMTIPNSILQNI